MDKLYRIDNRNRITIPDSVLKKINAKRGDYLCYDIKNGSIKLIKKTIS